MTLVTLSEKEIISTLLALALLLASAFLMGTLFEKFKAPRVVGGILGGLLLGGTCLHYLFPDFITGIFMAYEQEGKALNVFYQLGLIFLMFLSGYSTKLEMDRSNGKTISCVLIGATVLPMAFAVPFIGIFQDTFIGERGNEIAFGLVF